MSTFQRRIWLIGGTQESGEIAQILSVTNFFCTVTVTTPTAKTLYPQHPNLRVLVRSLNSSQVSQFCTQENIVAIVDASHPYALEVSQIAIACSTDFNIPYLRYERPSLDHISVAKNILYLDGFNHLLEGDYLLNKRVLLTVGYQVLPRFQCWQNRSILFARVLPVINSLQVALNSGFTPERIIALRPPISAELEQALWQQWQISLVVTKASGKAGGEDIKHLVANKLGIPLIIISRPQISYPYQTSNISEILAFCHQLNQ
jgi:precorrin-6A/cobalt-precorrin-6A reductase